MDDELNDVTVPVGFWQFGRLDAGGTFTAVRSDEAASLDTAVRLTGVFDSPSGTVQLFLAGNEMDAGATHTYTATSGSGDFAAGKGYAAGDSGWAHHLPGRINDLRLWVGAVTSPAELGIGTGA
ncbi:LamG-like jellyroll fold domain-containing protein [Streptomyces sp. NPDC051569]|uniref:LamG-like jellyroll fold domain-containing protein n=1 Tax=Streptomyces sp. NPDC051569 TaxID=3365661 RepID=UPI00379F26AC